MSGRPPVPSFAGVADFGALVRAARRAARGKRISNDAARFLLEVEPSCLALRDGLRDGSYRPGPYRTFEIREPKPRTISAASFADRVVHHALCAEIAGSLEHDAAPTSFACRPGGGQLRALRAAQGLVRRYPYVLKLDVEHFFETLSHAVLRRLLRRRLGHDARLMALVERFIDAGAPGAAEGRGVPIGNLTSQHFGNFYLGPLDRHLRAGFRAPFVRYMDDILVFGATRAALWEVARGVEAFAAARLDLRLKAAVTQVMPTRCGVPFLGFRVFAHLMPFDGARRRRFIRRLRGVLLLRFAARAFCALLFQLPPRLTRFEPPRHLTSPSAAAHAPTNARRSARVDPWSAQPIRLVADACAAASSPPRATAASTRPTATTTWAFGSAARRARGRIPRGPESVCPRTRRVCPSSVHAPSHPGPAGSEVTHPDRNEEGRGAADAGVSRAAAARP